MTYTPDPFHILSLKTDMPNSEIEMLDEAEAWIAIRKARDFQFQTTDPEQRKLLICVVGFSPEVNEKYGDEAYAAGFDVVGNVTKRLDFLVCGPSAPPSKMMTAEKFGAELLTEPEFKTLYKTGIFPKRF